MAAIGTWRGCIQRRGAEGAEKRFERNQGVGVREEFGFGARDKMVDSTVLKRKVLVSSSASY